MFRIWQLSMTIDSIHNSCREPVPVYKIRRKSYQALMNLSLPFTYDISFKFLVTITVKLQCSATFIIVRERSTGKASKLRAAIVSDPRDVLSSIEQGASCRQIYSITSQSPKLNCIRHRSITIHFAGGSIFT